MIRLSTEIRSARADETPQAVAAIVAAFITDRVARFAWPSPHDYLRGTIKKSQSAARPGIMGP
jgi:hypothetical protein